MASLDKGKILLGSVGFERCCALNDAAVHPECMRAKSGSLHKILEVSGKVMGPHQRRFSSMWRGSSRTLSPAASTGCSRPRKNRTFPHAWAAGCRLTLLGHIRRASFHSLRSELGIRDEGDSASKVLLVQVRHPRARQRCFSLTSEHGHESADVALSRAGPSSTLALFGSRPVGLPQLEEIRDNICEVAPKEVCFW